MQRSLRTIVLTLMFGSLWAGNLVAGCSSDPPEVLFPDASAVDGSGVPAGETCGAAGECASGHCVDGVCCDSACDSTCESCKLPGSVGQCTPVPDGEDPDEECVTPPRPPLPDAGDDDAGDDDAGTGDAGTGDAGPEFDRPDAAIVATDLVCAAKCNGKRACAFPGRDKTCGTTFCGNPTTQGRAACNGEGHCDVVIEACGAFACPNGSEGCKTSCLGPSDCASTHYCDGKSCQPKLANGTLATSGAQCQSGHVAGGVCCNDACNYATASCTQTGFEGTCRCTACTGGATPGSCKLWYKDRDNDGFGDETGTIGNGGAKPGCLDLAPSADPDGAFVANADDCFDADNRVRPNQTGWFTSGYGPNGSFDYNCDDRITKQYGEFATNATCRRCSGQYTACQTSTSCSAGQATGLGCIGLGGVGGFGFTSEAVEGESAVTPRQLIPILSCSTDTRSGFRGTVACGGFGTRYSCGACSGGSVPAATNHGTTQQGCN